MRNIMLRNVIEDDLPIFSSINRTMKRTIWLPLRAKTPVLGWLHYTLEQISY